MTIKLTPNEAKVIDSCIKYTIEMIQEIRPETKKSTIKILRDLKRKFKVK